MSLCPEANILVAHDQFSCPVCLEILKDPVAIPCGHSYCMGCIKNCWDQTDHTGVYSCPQCRETFTPRPVLCRNTMLSELVEKLKKTGLNPPPAQSYAGPGDVPCDFCTGRKFKAVKSCLTCLASYCETHVKPHSEGAAFKRHKLINAIGNLEQKLCAEHQRLCEVFCRTDQTCICWLCADEEHKSHDTVSAEKERTGKQCRKTFTPRPDLCRNTMLAELVEELKKTGLNPPPAQSYAGLGDVPCDFCTGRKFKAVKSCLTCLASYCETHVKPHSEGAAFKRHKLINAIGNLEQKLCAEHQRLCEVFCRTDQTCICWLCADEEHKSHDTVSAEKERTGKQKQLGETQTEIQQRIQERLKETEELKQAVETLKKPSLLYPSSSLQSDSCQLTLDPNTAHRNLCLSEGNRKVTQRRETQRYRDHPERFDVYTQVLCREGLSGTRCYWEIEWNGGGADIGVTYKGIGRKGGDYSCRLGYNDKSWSLFGSDSSYSAQHNNNHTAITAPRSPRIGVYLDLNAGTLSFYGVSDTMTLLHRFQTTITEPLYPGFWVWGSGSSLTICQLN
ncbi:UNVERIFIED_CONTAM: hypothetical protein FKN15_075129 [Acipenser sinensis]